MDICASHGFQRYSPARRTNILTRSRQPNCTSSFQIVTTRSPFPKPARPSPIRRKSFIILLIPFGNQREAPYLCNMKRKLIVDIETMMKFKPQTHKDFILLSNRIMDSTQQYVSATTLKRVWGCKHDYNSPSQFTLNVLSRFLGFADF